MCGIVGAVLKENNGFFKKQEDSFFQMLFADQIRGEDSTGIIGVEKDTTFHVLKEACNASVFIPQVKFHSTNTSMWNKGRAYIGHNRKKTVGSISDKTAHPFVVDKNFAMVHNGTLYNHDKLAKDCSVDSEALAIHLQQALWMSMVDGDDNTGKFIEDALEHVYGAYAVAMYDQTRNKIFLVRNKERPLSLIETDDAWYFMSESLMGAWILSRNGYEYSKLKVSGISEYELISFDLDKSTIKREQLNPKKSYPLSQKYTNYGKTSGKIIQIGGEINTNSKKMGGPCSDKEFKRFRKDFLSKRVTVVIDDYLEVNFPREKLEEGNAEELVLYSQYNPIPYMHTINTLVNIKKFGITSSDEILGKKWVIDIEDAKLSPQGVIIITGGDPKPVVSSLSSDDVRREWRSQLSKLLYEDLNSLSEEMRFTGETWQINAINAEIGWRDSCGTLETAHDRAKKRNLILYQTQQNGKFIYKDSEGNVYFEAAIAVH